MKPNANLLHTYSYASFRSNIRILTRVILIVAIALPMQHSWCNQKPMMFYAQLSKTEQELDNAYARAFNIPSPKQALPQDVPQTPELLFKNMADLNSARQKVLQSEQMVSERVSSLIQNNLKLFNPAMADYLTNNVIKKYDTTQRALYKALLDYYDALIVANLDHTEQQNALTQLKHAIDLSSPLASTPTLPVSVKDRYLNLIDSCASLFNPKRFSSKVLPNKKLEHQQQEIQRFIINSIDKLHYAILKTESSVINAFQINQPQESPVTMPVLEPEVPVTMPNK